jgi:hypothetical protein
MAHCKEREHLGQMRLVIGRPAESQVALIFDHGAIILSDAEADQVEIALAAARRDRQAALQCKGSQYVH